MAPGRRAPPDLALVVGERVDEIAETAISYARAALPEQARFEEVRSRVLRRARDSKRAIYEALVELDLAVVCDACAGDRRAVGSGAKTSPCPCCAGHGFKGIPR